MQIKYNEYREQNHNRSIYPKKEFVALKVHIFLNSPEKDDENEPVIFPKSYFH